MSNEIIRDAVEAALEKNAVDFKSLINDILAAKVADRLAPVREAMEQSVFGEGPEDEDDVEDLEDDEEGDDDWAGFEIDDEEEVEEDEDFDDGEQVDEVSSKTLKSYIAKSGSSSIKLDQERRKLKDSPSRIANARKRKNREEGRDTAHSKMGTDDEWENKVTRVKANEDIEQVDEISSKTLNSYRKKASDSKELAGYRLEKHKKAYAANREFAKPEKDVENIRGEKLTDKELKSHNRIRKDRGEWGMHVHKSLAKDRANTIKKREFGHDLATKKLFGRAKVAATD
jgi:hypothetical protein